jgi:hypothetical protein
MAIFGKSKPKPNLGLGRTVESSPDASSGIIEGEVIESGPIVLEKTESDELSESSRIVAELSSAKPSKAEIKAAKKLEREKALAEKAAKKAAEKEAKKLGSGKSNKQKKEELEAEEIAKANVRLSNSVMIDFFPGMAKEDAIETARHWAMTHMDMPSMCFYHVMKIRDGYAIEVQEGVGRAYLPSVLELAQANPGRLIVIPMIRRKMTVFYSARLGEFEAQILPELQEPPVMPESPPIQAVRGPSMTPIMRQHKELMIIGMVTALIGGLSLLSSLAIYAFDEKAKVPPEWKTTDVAQLPIMQWGRLQADASDSYVTRLEYQDGNWRVVRQAVGASVDVASVGNGASSPGIVGGVVQAPSDIPPAGPVSPPAGNYSSSPTNIPPPNGVPNQ